MKKYIPAKMIHQSRFITFFETWNENDKAQLINDIICKRQLTSYMNKKGVIVTIEITSFAMDDL